MGQEYVHPNSRINVSIALPSVVDSEGTRGRRQRAMVIGRSLDANRGEIAYKEYFSRNTVRGRSEIHTGVVFDLSVPLGQRSLARAPVCGIPSGASGDDELFGGRGNDDLHRDNKTDSGDPVLDSGDGIDICVGAAGIDTRGSL